MLNEKKNSYTGIQRFCSYGKWSDGTASSFSSHLHLGLGIPNNRNFMSSLKSSSLKWIEHINAVSELISSLRRQELIHWSRNLFSVGNLWYLIYFFSIDYYNNQTLGNYLACWRYLNVQRKNRARRTTKDCSLISDLWYRWRRKMGRKLSNWRFL